MSDCGHSDEEHEAMAEEIQARINQGDITALIPAIDNRSLNMLLQAAAAELFIRSEDWETARANWDQLDELVRTTLFVDRAEDSAFPEEYEMLKDAQKKYHQLLAPTNANVEQMVHELERILAEHGVQEAQRPQKPNDDFPGFYL